MFHCTQKDYSLSFSIGLQTKNVKVLTKHYVWIENYFYKHKKYKHMYTLFLILSNLQPFFCDSRIAKERLKGDFRLLVEENLKPETLLTYNYYLETLECVTYSVNIISRIP